MKPAKTARITMMDPKLVRISPRFGDFNAMGAQEGIILFLRDFVDRLFFKKTIVKPDDTIILIGSVAWDRGASPSPSEHSFAIIHGEILMIPYIAPSMFVEHNCLEF